MVCFLLRPALTGRASALCNKECTLTAAFRLRRFRPELQFCFAPLVGRRVHIAMIVPRKNLPRIKSRDTQGFSLIPDSTSTSPSLMSHELSKQAPLLQVTDCEPLDTEDAARWESLCVAIPGKWRHACFHTHRTCMPGAVAKRI